MWVSKKKKENLGKISGKTRRVKPKANEEGFLRMVNEAFPPPPPYRKDKVVTRVKCAQGGDGHVCATCCSGRFLGDGRALLGGTHARSEADSSITPPCPDPHG